MIDEVTELFTKALENVHGRNKVNDVIDLDRDRMTSIVLSCLRMGMMRKSDLQAIAVDIGNRMRNRMGLPRKSDDAAHTGLFFLIALHEAQIINIFGYQPPKAKFMKYIVCHTIRKWDLKKAFTEYERQDDGYEILLEPPAPWDSGKHRTGRQLVRRSGPNGVLDRMSPEAQPIVFKVVNDKQRIGWIINTRLLNVQSWILENGAPDGLYPFEHMDPDMTDEARETKFSEISNIIEYAYAIGDLPFYHLYNLDFRGRAYPNSQVLHEQSCDEAKSLLRFAKGTRLRSGYNYMVDHVANNWGFDKDTLVDKRVKADELMGDWLDYAADPITNTGWMSADKPWSFLSGCFELYALAEWVDDGNRESDFITHMPCFIDGSNNGLQHIAAATKDETVGRLVNLTESDEFGDAYLFMADAAYDIIREEYDPSLDGLFNEIREEFYQWGERIDNAETAEERYKLIEKLKVIRKSRNDDIIKVAPNYWMQQEVYDKRRKTVKRNVMTLAYGGTEFGFMRQIVEDTKLWGHHWKHMEYKWASYLGSKIYKLARGGDGIQAKLPGCAKALDMFEALAETASAKDEHLAWSVPITNFPVLQDYKKATDKRIETNWDDTRHRLVIKMWEESILDRKAQKTAASPNIIHSLDAAHLMMTCYECDFPLVTIHDSFGCMAGDMEELHTIVRSQLVKLYKTDPISNILGQHGAQDLRPEDGNLDLESINKAQFTFI